MRRSEIPGWRRTIHRLSGWHHRLTVEYPADQPFWATLGLEAYTRGTLPGLAPVQSAATAVVQAGRLEPDGEACYLKQFLHRDPMDPLKDLLRASRARRALRNERIATALGFHLPRSLCLLEARRGGRLVYNALVTEAVEHARRARDWIMEAPDRHARRRFLLALAREIGAWHGAGLYHGDLRPGNILAQSSDDGFTFWWLDNERNRRYAVLPPGRRIHNLMQINYEPLPISLTDRLRFWRAYRETARLPDDQAADVLRRVIAKTQRRWRKRGWLK
jgi:tRNA A-37 threonylcarbamoyl transferase component Bud32